MLDWDKKRTRKGKQTSFPTVQNYIFYKNWKKELDQLVDEISLTVAEV